MGRTPTSPLLFRSDCKAEMVISEPEMDYGMWNSNFNNNFRLGMGLFSVWFYGRIWIEIDASGKIITECCYSAGSTVREKNQTWSLGER